MQVHSQFFVSKQSLILLSLLCLSIFLWTSWTATTQGRHESRVESSYYHLLVPASEANAGLCKTIFSAAALGYPTPRLLNWQGKFNDEHLIFGGSHIAKITGVLEFLRQLGPQSDHEIVSIVDGYDVWFQLRPEVMISRYHQINRRANDRIRSRIGSSVARTNDVRQTVIFSAQKKCWPAAADDPACFAVPESELPRDVYGPRTDQMTEDEKNPFEKLRQRYLNSGAVIGPVGDVRAIMERAAQKANVSTNFGSDQGIFADIFGEQEYQREVLRKRHISWIRRLRDRILRMFSSATAQDKITLPHPTHHRMEDIIEENYEFHLGLDYQGELSQPTVFSENDLAWVRHSDREATREKVNAAGSGNPSLFDHLASDIDRSTPPFWTLDTDLAQRLPVDSRWEQMAMYANMWTGHTPAAIHHNAHHDGLKDRIRTFWDETWFFPHLREILQARFAEVKMPVAVVPVTGGDGKNLRREWWDPIDERGGVRIEVGALPGDWLSWQDLCGTQEIAEEVFRDGRGPWVDPVVLLSWNNEEAAEQLVKWKQKNDS